MDIKTIPSSRLKHLGVKELYHISFNGSLEGLWDPEFNQKPDENHPEVPDPDKEEWYPEPNIGRISVAEDIQGCFIGVYPNVSKYFEVNKYPNMNFFVYSPVFKGDERVVTPGILTADRLVWDAHVTGEYLILDEVMMKLVGEVQIANTNKIPTGYTHPFNDKKEPKASIGPQRISVRWTKHF